LALSAKRWHDPGMTKTVRLVLWETVFLLPGLLWLAQPGALQRTWHSPYLRWLLVGAVAFYAAYLLYWLNILLCGGWAAVAVKLEDRAAARTRSAATRSPLGENITLAFIALLMVVVFVVPVLLRRH